MSYGKLDAHCAEVLNTNDSAKAPHKTLILSFQPHKTTPISLFFPPSHLISIILMVRHPALGDSPRHRHQRHQTIEHHPSVQNLKLFLLDLTINHGNEHPAQDLCFNFPNFVLTIFLSET